MLRIQSGSHRYCYPAARADAMKRRSSAWLLLCLAGVACRTADVPSSAGLNTSWEVALAFEVDTSAIRLRGAMPVDQGFVVATDSRIPMVRYDEAGRINGRSGRMGAGPDEFRRPTAFGIDRATGSVVVYDAGKAQLVRLDGDRVHALGRLGLSKSPPVSADFESEWYGEAQPVMMVGDRVLAVHPRRTLSVPGDLVAFDVFSARPESEATLLLSIDPDSATVPWYNRGGVAPMPLFASCGTDGWVAYTPHDGRVVWRDAAGKESSHDLGLPTNPVPDADKLAIFRHQISSEIRGPLDERMEAMARQAVEQSDEYFSPVRPDFVAAGCTRSGTVWLQRYDSGFPPSFRGLSWLTLTLNGDTAAVHWPVAARLLWIDDDRALGVQSDADDVEQMILLRPVRSGVP